ncbi:hypothetical protein SLS64_005647 [Diaporthe eres]|uniref:Uncharacterized protein n=1 Tax=Diaporthe eres TaxID=83184 RepID=A0ABR1NTV0_DIAER
MTDPSCGYPRTQAQRIINCLADAKLAERSLVENMNNLEQDMKECATWAQDTEARFKKLKGCAMETKQSMAHEMSKAKTPGNSAVQVDTAAEEIKQAEEQKRMQEKNILFLKNDVEDARSEFDRYKHQFNRELKRGETSAFFHGMGLEATSTVASTINAGVSLVEQISVAAIDTTGAAINMAGTVMNMPLNLTVAAAGAFSGSAPTAGAHVSDRRASPPTQLKVPPEEDVLLVAEPIEKEISFLRDLLTGLERGGEEDLQIVNQEATACCDRLKWLKQNLGTSGHARSAKSVKAEAMIDDAIFIAVAIAEFQQGQGGGGITGEQSSQDNNSQAAGKTNTDKEGGEGQDKRRGGGLATRTAHRLAKTFGGFGSKSGSNAGRGSTAESALKDLRKRLSALAADAIQLRTFVAAQRGQGFGSSLDSFANPNSQVPGPGESGYEKVMRARYLKLHTTREVMKEARSRLDDMRSQQKASEDAIEQLNGTLESAKLATATAEETKKALAQSIDVIGEAQEHMSKLAQFFTYFANVIHISGVGHADNFIRVVRDGIRSDNSGFAIQWSAKEARAIKEAVFTLRAHVAKTNEVCDLYDDIAKEYIDPCMTMATSLPVSATSIQQEEAQRKLQKYAADCSIKIKVMAENERAKWERTHQQRIQEIEGEIKQMPIHVIEDAEECQAAIQRGIEDARNQFAQPAEKLGPC